MTGESLTVTVTGWSDDVPSPSTRDVSGSRVSLTMVVVDVRVVDPLLWGVLGSPTVTLPVNDGSGRLRTPWVSRPHPRRSCLT